MENAHDTILIQYYRNSVILVLFFLRSLNLQIHEIKIKYISIQHFFLDGEIMNNFDFLLYPPYIF